MKLKIFALTLAIASGLLTGSIARAQHHHHDNHYTPSYHVDHHDHVVRDGHGHVIGRYHHNVVHENSSYILPHSGNSHTGTYYSHDGGYYYHPNSGSRTAHTSQPAQIEFGGFSHVDDLAGRLDSLANEFCLDLHYNYSHNQGYAETYGEAYQILQIAKYIHAAEHQQDRQAIAEQMNGLDSLFHHVQDEVRVWERHQHRQIGQLGLISKIDLMESTIHHLMYDVGVEHAQGEGEQAPPPGGIGGEQAPPPPGGFAPGAPGGAAPGPGVITTPPPGLPPMQ